MKCLLIILLTALSIGCKGQNIERFNLDFENFNSGKALPDGWVQWGKYDLEVDSLNSHVGRFCLKIKSNEIGTFGSAAYMIPANYAGGIIQLEGYIKVKDVENGFAGLLLRLNGDEQILALDDMQKQNVNGTKDWQKYSIQINYPANADKIYVGGILSGKGEAWFDNIVLKIDGNNIQTLKEVEKKEFPADLDKEFSEGSRVQFPILTPDLVTNLDALGKIWGFLKYHHPQICEGNYHWDYELFRFLPKFLNSNNITDRNKLLLEWVNSYGVPPKCKKCTPTSTEAFLKPDMDWIKNSNFSPNLEKTLLNIYQNRHQEKQFYVNTTSIGQPEFTNEKAYSQMAYPDEGFRLLTVYRYWNIIHYFFPYKHLIDKDWSKIMIEYLPKFIDAKTELDFELVVLQLIGEVKDTHANLMAGDNEIANWKGKYYPPVNVRFIEKKLVVTDYYNIELKAIAQLEIGDIITKINGQEVSTLIDEKKKYYPASNEAALLRNLSLDLLRSKDSILLISYTRGAVEKQKELKLYKQNDLDYYRWYRNSTEKSYTLLNDSIGYITLKSIKEEDIPQIKEAFKNTKGIIIDIRNYPSTFVPFSLGAYFLNAPTPFAKFTRMNLNNPGEFIFTPTFYIPKTSESYRGKLIVLVNEITQSQAEYTAMAFRASPNTIVVGSTTAGADGNVAAFFLPGGLKTMISGIGVYYPNGAETQRVGIVPNIEVTPTIKGILEGKDELIEKAIQIISKN